ncbi:MAG TPA: energy-coupling factor transporter transmembrane protein EcfT [Firmicutes bacterium]|nr:energy-coupling factor transporter transmembrane protein EcfT [Bacillota bacterium]
MLVFQERDLFFQAIHPAAMLFYLAVVVIGAVAFSHPLYLLVFFVPCFAALIVSGGLGDWLRSARFFFLLIVIFALINVLVNRLGGTVLLWGPTFPLLGRINVTLETLVFALVMGIRLLTVFTAFMLYNQAVNPDRVLSMAAKLLPRSALLVALATKTMPHLLRKLRGAGEIAQCRGVNFHTGNFLTRVKNRLPLIRVLLISSLEDSFNIGESIQARAYGSGPRTSYFYHCWCFGDTLVFATSFFALLIIIFNLVRGWGDYSFYPHLDKIVFTPHLMAVLSVLFIMLMVPVLAAWGWNKWSFLK